jgi:hypothetical protein
VSREATKMGLRDQLRRLKREAKEEMIVIPQRDGTVRRFTEQDMKDAFVNLVDRGGAGDDAPPEHPILEAVRNSSDPEWLNSFYGVGEPEEHTQPVEDLSS